MNLIKLITFHKFNCPPLFSITACSFLSNFLSTSLILPSSLLCFKLRIMSRSYFLLYDCNYCGETAVFGLLLGLPSPLIEMLTLFRLCFLRFDFD